MYDSSTCVYTVGQPAAKGGEEIAELESELGCISLVLSQSASGPSMDLQLLRAAGMSSGREMCDVRW